MNENQDIHFKPSLKTEYLKIGFSIILALLITILAKNGVFNPDFFKINLKDLGVEMFRNSQTILNILSVIYIICGLYIILKIFNMIYIKLYYSYKIERNKIVIVEGILFKNVKTFPIRNIKNVDILQPTIFQLIINVRNLRLEVDGISGYDDLFLNITNYNDIKESIYNRFNHS